MPKLLDFIKEKGLSHEDVIKLLSASEDSEDSDEEKIEDEEDEEEEDEEIEDEEDTKIDENNDDKTKPITLDDVKLLITKALEGSRKAKRKAPSKGKKGKGTPQKPIYTREDMFEEMF